MSNSSSETNPRFNFTSTEYRANLHHWEDEDTAPIAGEEERETQVIVHMTTADDLILPSLKTRLESFFPEGFSETTATVTAKTTELLSLPSAHLRIAGVLSPCEQMLMVGPLSWVEERLAEAITTRVQAAVARRLHPMALGFSVQVVSDFVSHDEEDVVGELLRITGAALEVGWSDEAKLCGVCLEEFAGGSPAAMVVRTTCSHLFHISCIGSWVLGWRKRTCPLCRFSFGQDRRTSFDRFFET